MKACIGFGTFSVSLLTALASAASTPPSSKTHINNPVIPRPDLQAHPFPPTKPFPKSSARQASKTCFVSPKPVGQDDAPAILKAFHDCNNGGTVVLDKAYTIASPLDLTFLNAVDVAITGTVKFTDDIPYWTEHTFKYAYQNASTWWRFGGKDVNIYGAGKGVIDGNGQAWYDEFVVNQVLRRPILFVLDGLHGGSVTGLKLRNTPFWFNLIANSSDVLVSDIDMSAESTSANEAKNTDGWDTLRSDNIVIQSSTIQNNDDCVSFKPNSTNILVQNLLCRDSRGISVGSLGQYPGQYDIVENVYVYNTLMRNASAGARIKVWPSGHVNFQAALSGGGGSGYVKNVTFDSYHNVNNDWAIEVNQCYGTKDLKFCHENPTNIVLSDITFKNIYGTTSKQHDPLVGTIRCSHPSRCHNIQAHNVTLTQPSGKKPEWVCENVDRKLLDINCTA
ncbi:hypothetical protein E4U43_002833 [Claviceps pusilla]|uniref:galacturonan 1,4-alpha-galacturonidase n=1 Tax=Claviceps pusilla TaxID=123648 RepID=A0A9P7N5M1_9HYPO|nr:hypothetical protein E4U43_002833 [Claviceps pusilla]